MLTKICFALLVLLLVISIPNEDNAMNSISTDDSEYPVSPQHVLHGHYHLLGFNKDTGASYLGRTYIHATFESEGLFLFISRELAGKTLSADAELQSINQDGDTAEVLQIAFQKNGEKYLGMCHWNIDLKGFPQITCQIYRGSLSGEPVALEALFFADSFE
ncbi:hypothetical protein [Vibrio sp. SCSIO 43137]|uniref:hypothetical protein n=1 Tax=Vibrio sp. SCSIO 43137 TaxID=3021011 RepID=UPI00230768B9|nr:hypothetical protein [Vibrio sp. SCSIO 43137]WCE32475.1 hypothetical protein PK654_18460 [Vibrio sp. SCSIO 43137]